MIIFISLIFICILIIHFFSVNKHMEPFTLNDAGVYPHSTTKPILNDFPLISHPQVSNNTYNKIWWHFPIFSVGSYEQITNNLRHVNNPDNGTCERADMCGALYHNVKNKSNYIMPLPEAEEGDGARVGYFRTNPNKLFFSIPTNENILY